MSVAAERAAAARGTTAVLVTLASAQFLMALGSSVMNVSIASVANGLSTGRSRLSSAR